ncbi:MAG TPA: hypothetical protein ENN99_03435 [Chloroflexi bacterium]|nr:hypothetical protein [Chloroflexota bacterium]
MEQRGIMVRRAKPSDTGKIAAFVNQAAQGRLQIDEGAIVARFGNVGFFLAERDGALLGMLGWQAENLVVRVTDFLISSISEREEVGQALLSEMERSARELECEVILLFLPRPTPPSLIQFYQTLEYESQTVAELPKAWLEAAREAGRRDDETMMLRKLREKRVLRPM